MAEIQKREDLNNQTHTAGEAVLRNSGVRGLVASDLPTSEVIGTLTKRVRESKLQTEKYGYLAPEMFGSNMVFDGLIDVNYSEMSVEDSTNPYADTTIADFNAGLNEAVRFTYEAKTQNNVKTKILNETLMNFKTTPGDAIKAIFSGTENINKEQMLRWAKQVWTELEAKSVDVDCAGAPSVATEGDSISKTIYTTLINFGKNSKAHLGVGNGVNPGEITQGGTTITPTYKFNSEDFYLLTTPEFEADIEMDGNRVLFNWEGKSFKTAGVKTLYLDDEEMPTAVATAWADAAAVLVHKNAVMGIQDWEGTGIANAGKLYQVFHNYMKQDAFPMYDAPVVVFNKGTAPIAK